MSTAHHHLSDYDPNRVPSGAGKTFAIIVSEWNSEVTHALAQGAHETLLANGVSEEDIMIYHVPGSFELIYASGKLVRGAGKPNAVIALGCVVQGETPHFDYICQAVSHSLGAMNAKGDVPVIFGLLTTNTMQQALDRSGGKYGNKGVEAAVTALKMAANFGW